MRRGSDGEALDRERPEVFNTDQGSQFTSQEFTQVLQDRGVKISMDGKGRYADNIFVERLWRTVKYEEVYLKAYASAGEARRELGGYFRFYNDQRPHQALGYRTPGEVFSEGQAPQNEESTVGRWSPEADGVCYAGAAGSARHWPPGGGRRRRHGYGRGGCVVASIGCSFSGVGFLFQTHYPRFRGAPFRPFRIPLTPTPSVDSGLDFTTEVVKSSYWENYDICGRVRIPSGLRYKLVGQRGLYYKLFGGRLPCELPGSGTHHRTCRDQRPT